MKRFRSFVKEFRRDIVGIVVGGGQIARTYIGAARELGASKFLQDRVGINATLLNAWLVASALGDVSHGFASTFYPITVEGEKVPVFGGTEYPGLTTDFAAALLAEMTGSDFVNITRVGGIYDKNPDKHPDAKLIRRMSYAELLRLAQVGDKREPGTSFPIDIAAIHILRRSNIRTYVVGKDIKNLRKLFRGEEWTGTEITP